MKTTERRAKTLQYRQQHIEALQRLGYTRPTMHAIKRLEHEANAAQVAQANGEMNEDEGTAADERIKQRLAVLFGGTLPRGFFINGDPRGYTLKLDPEAWKVSEDARENYEALPIKMTDWGGYMILAPEEL